MMESVHLLVNQIKSTLFSTNSDNNLEAVTYGLKICDETLSKFKKLLNNAKNNGEKQKLTTAIGHVKSFKTRFNLLKITGKGYVPRKETASTRVKWSDVESAFNSRIRTGVITNLKHTDPKLFFDDALVIFKRRISIALKEHEFIKVNTTFCGEFVLQKSDVEIREYKYFNTKNVPIYRETDLRKWFFDNVQQVILAELEEFQERESGWALSAIVNLQVNINKFTPQVGSSYIPLPPIIDKKHACINVKNTDQRCFVWSVVSALYPVEKNPQRVTKYPDPSSVLNLTGIQFPITLKQIPRFEKQNAISINVYILKKKTKTMVVVPIYLTKIKQSTHINLLMIQDNYVNEDKESENGVDENDEFNFGSPKFHFVWIKNLSRLLSNQLSKNNRKKYFCDRCLHCFHSESRLDKHYEDCMKMNYCKIRLPTEDKKFIKFKNYENKVKAPFVIYADVECLLVPCENKNKYQDHKPCSIGYYVKCSYDDSLSFYRNYRGETCIEWFIKELEDFAENLETVFLCPLPMESLTPDEQVNYDKALFCHICAKSFSYENGKVRDHDHLTGKYRGAAHRDCNINFKDTHTVPVIFHNLSGYDSHFIIKNLVTDIKGRVEVLPINKERYISFTKHLEDNLIKFRFIDSCRFMASGLDTLASYLKEYPDIESEFHNISDEQMKLLTRKGVYPYDYFIDFKKFDETNLPPKSNFFNYLNDCNISDEDYQHANKVWNEFQCRTLGDYSDLYLKTDVLLLTCVFEEFRRGCLKTYELDPAHYFTLPGFTWDCMLKHTQVNLELLTDVDMIMLIERGIRGGLSQCSGRYAKANNKYCANYDSSQPTNYLMYNDINNQYGWAMSKYLPYGGFKWVSAVDDFNVIEIADDSDIGYILEVDLEYPQELHDTHADLPFCPEHRCASGSKQEKLMATLYDKNRYVIHYYNLKQALNHGLKLTKIHRILQFHQSAWLKSYIDLNTKLRAAAENDFEKNLFKLMNNAVFGKTMENIRKHSIVKLVSKWYGRYGAEALIAKPEFKSSTIFNENLVAIELNKTELFFNKPIYIGMSILDISKTKIYEFHYDYTQKIFENKCHVLYTDTDSLIYNIECPDIYEIIRRDCYERFDTSDFPKDNIYNIPSVNKKVLGLMKDEMNGKVMTEFIGLRSKMYAVRVNENDAVKKIKGVKKHIVKHHITFDDYLECLNNLTEKNIIQNLIKSERHKVSTICQSKIALSPHDNKRYLMKGCYDTLPWGHYTILNVNNNLEVVL